MSIRFIQEPFDGCVAFLNSGIYKNVPEEWWAPTEGGLGGGSINVSTLLEHHYIYGKSEGWLSEGAKSELTSTDILNACEICKGQEYCQIYWTFGN